MDDFHFEINPVMRLFILLLFQTTISVTLVADTIVVRNNTQLLDIGLNTFLYSDESNKLSPDEIHHNANFIKSDKLINTFPVTKATIWIKFILKNETDEPVYLKIAEPSIDSISFFKLINNKPVLLSTAGFIKPFHQRQINDPNYYFNLNARNDITEVYYLRFKMINAESMSIPLTVGFLKNFYENGILNSGLAGILFGIIIMVLIFNLALYLTIRDKSYILFVIYLIFVLIFILVLKGIAFQIIWPSYPGLNFYIPTFASMGCLSSIVFSKYFLQISNTFNNKILNLVSLIYIAIIIINLLGNYSASLILTQINTIALCIILPSIAFYKYLNNYKPALYYFIAWFFFFTGILIFIMQINDLINANVITRNAIPIGLTLETIIMSFAVGYRMKIIKQNKKMTELELIESYRKNSELIKEHNKILEARVKERTRELEEVQQNIIYQERLASIGQITAGITHEIQNPLNFINNFALLAKESLNDKETEKENKPDVINYLDKIIHHGRRAETIVKELIKHTDNTSGNRQSVNINKLCEEYFYLAYNYIQINHINFKCRTELQLENDIPELMLVSQQFAKVLMNLYTNAFYEVSKIEDGYVTVRTVASEGAINISIENNGSSIPEENRENIFKPFFTTKPPGKGTGLGLSISRDIIKSYGGSIELVPTEDKHTKFVISLPVNNHHSETFAENAK